MDRGLRRQIPTLQPVHRHPNPAKLPAKSPADHGVDAKGFDTRPQSWTHLSLGRTRALGRLRPLPCFRAVLCDGDRTQPCGRRQSRLSRRQMKRPSDHDAHEDTDTAEPQVKVNDALRSFEKELDQMSESNRVKTGK